MLHKISNNLSEEMLLSRYVVYQFGEFPVFELWKSNNVFEEIFIENMRMRKINFDYILLHIDNAAKKPQSHSAELEALQDLLQYPEEIALTLTEVENNLFYQVPPIDYLRQVTLDPDGSPTSRITVNTLADRFRQVNIVCFIYGSP